MSFSHAKKLASFFAKISSLDERGVRGVYRHGAWSCGRGPGKEIEFLKIQV